MVSTFHQQSVLRHKSPMAKQLLLRTPTTKVHLKKKKKVKPFEKETYELMKQCLVLFTYCNILQFSLYYKFIISRSFTKVVVIFSCERYILKGKSPSWQLRRWKIYICSSGIDGRTSLLSDCC